MVVNYKPDQTWSTVSCSDMINSPSRTPSSEFGGVPSTDHPRDFMNKKCITAGIVGICVKNLI